MVYLKIKIELMEDSNPHHENKKHTNQLGEGSYPIKFMHYSTCKKKRPYLQVHYKNSVFVRSH